VLTKVGYLSVLNTYLDPHRTTDNITFTNEQKEIFELEVFL
jgi:hypothetical protein